MDQVITGGPNKSDHDGDVGVRPVSLHPLASLAALAVKKGA
jgi:hypothetical protein